MLFFRNYILDASVVDVEERYRRYFQFLNELYDLTNGSEIPQVNFWEIGEKMGTGGMPSEETQNIVKWLKGEYLIKYTQIGPMIGLTHEGIKEVEDARRNPNKDTSHFSPLTIQNVINFHGSVTNSAIQQGNTNSSQTATISIQQISLLNEIIADLKRLAESTDLPQDKKEELREEIQLLEIQAKSKHPKWDRIKASLEAAKPIAGAVVAGAPIALKIMSMLAGGG